MFLENENSWKNGTVGQSPLYTPPSSSQDNPLHVPRQESPPSSQVHASTEHPTENEVKNLFDGKELVSQESAQPLTRERVDSEPPKAQEQTTSKTNILGLSILVTAYKKITSGLGSGKDFVSGKLGSGIDYVAGKIAERRDLKKQEAFLKTLENVGRPGVSAPSFEKNEEQEMIGNYFDFTNLSDKEKEKRINYLVKLSTPKSAKESEGNRPADPKLSPNKELVVSLLTHVGHADSLLQILGRLDDGVIASFMEKSELAKGEKLSELANKLEGFPKNKKSTINLGYAKQLEREQQKGFLKQISSHIEEGNVTNEDKLGITEYFNFNELSENEINERIGLLFEHAPKSVAGIISSLDINAQLSVLEQIISYSNLSYPNKEEGTSKTNKIVRELVNTVDNKTALKLAKKQIEKELNSPGITKQTLFRGPDLSSKLVSALQDKLIIPLYKDKLAEMCASLPGRVRLDPTKDSEFNENELSTKEDIAKADQEKIKQATLTVFDTVVEICQDDKFPEEIVKLNKFTKEKVLEKFKDVEQANNVPTVWFILRFINPLITSNMELNPHLPHTQADEVHKEKTGSVNTGQVVMKIANNMDHRTKHAANPLAALSGEVFEEGRKKMLTAMEKIS